MASWGKRVTSNCRPTKKKKEETKVCLLLSRGKRRNFLACWDRIPRARCAGVGGGRRRVEAPYFPACARFAKEKKRSLMTLAPR